MALPHEPVAWRASTGHWMRIESTTRHFCLFALGPWLRQTGLDKTLRLANGQLITVRRKG